MAGGGPIVAGPEVRPRPPDPPPQHAATLRACVIARIVCLIPLMPTGEANDGCDFIRSKMAAKASADPARASCRADLVAARRKLYAAAKARDAALKLEAGAMAEAAHPLVNAARLLPDA